MGGMAGPSMTLALAVWLCTLPFVFLLMVPWRGTPAAITTALVLLAVIAVVCWLICASVRVRDGDLPGGGCR